MNKSQLVKQKLDMKHARVILRAVAGQITAMSQGDFRRFLGALGAAGVGICPLTILDKSVAAFKRSSPEGRPSRRSFSSRIKARSKEATLPSPRRVFNSSAKSRS